ncbi:hypothetical protein LM500704_20005 [Listeria monocytogenes]|nr:hypothetical protein LM500704_20005 [Listeria monocytogenes]
MRFSVQAGNKLRWYRVKFSRPYSKVFFLDKGEFYFTLNCSKWRISK